MFSAFDPVHQVTLIDEVNGRSTTVQIGQDEFILESAEDQGVSLPGACYAGKCVTCVAKLLQGKVEQDHAFLRPEEISAGYILTCKSSPRSDCVILTHQEEALFGPET